MQKRVAFKANPAKQQYWLLNNQDVNFVENDTSIITTASKFIHDKYSALDVHFKGQVQALQSINDDGTPTLALKIAVISGNLSKGTLIAAAGMHYGHNPMNQKLMRLQKKGAIQKGTQIEFRGAAITYHLWKGMPLNRNFLMYEVGINQSLPQK